MSGGRELLHPLDSLPLISAERAAGFATVGIGSVEELVAAGAPRAKDIADAVGGLSEQQLIDQVLPAGWFVLLGDLGRRGAAALVKGGVSSYLALTDAATGRVVSALSSLDPAPDAHACAQLQLTAAKAMLSFRVLLRVMTESSPASRPEVTVGGAGFDTSGRSVTVVGDRDGWVLTPPLRRDSSHLLAIKSGRQVHSLNVVATAAAPIQTAYLNFSTAPKPTIRDEPGDPIKMLTGWETEVSRTVATTKRLRAGTPLLVGAPDDKGECRLSTALREYSGGIVLVSTVQVAAADLPRRVEPGDVVLVAADGGLKKAGAARSRKILSSRQLLDLTKGANR